MRVAEGAGFGAFALQARRGGDFGRVARALDFARVGCRFGFGNALFGGFGGALGGGCGFGRADDGALQTFVRHFKGRAFGGRESFDFGDFRFGKLAFGRRQFLLFVFDAFSQRFDFGGQQNPKFARQKSFQLHARERDAAQRVDRMADGFHHAFDLAIAAFAQNQLHERVFVALGHHFGAARRRRAVIEAHAALQFFNRSGFDDAAHARFVNLFGAVRRMRQEMRQFAVVSEQKHARSIEIEASDGMQTLPFARQKIHHGRATAGIIFGRHHEARFVKHQNHARFFGNPQRVAINHDAVVERVGFDALLGDGVAVDRDAARRDHFFGGAARSETGARDQFGNALAFADFVRLETWLESGFEGIFDGFKLVFVEFLEFDVVEFDVVKLNVIELFNGNFGKGVLRLGRRNGSGVVGHNGIV